MKPTALQRVQDQNAAMTRKTKAVDKRFMVCVANDGYPASLELSKIYVLLPDAVTEKLGLLRIIDESGSDYLYPKSFFHRIELPLPIKKAVLAAA